jgi:carbon storage regulator
MLVLSRRLGEEIVIEGGIRLTVVAIQGNRVRIGVEAPPSVTVLRDELLNQADPAGRPGRGTVQVIAPYGEEIEIDG